MVRYCGRSKQNGKLKSLPEGSRGTLDYFKRTGTSGLLERGAEADTCLRFDRQEL